MSMDDRAVTPIGGWAQQPDGSWTKGNTRADKDGNIIPPILEDDEGFDECDIPRRAWIAGSYLLRKSVTLVGGPPSAGKSSLMIGWGTALVLGRQWHKVKPTKPCVVALYNVEDDKNEQRRRIAACLRQFEVSPHALAGKLVRLSPSGNATLIRYNPETRVWEYTEAMIGLLQCIARRKPDVLILDPFVELHDAEENDNTAIRAVLAIFRLIAEQYDLAVVILHHTRKGSQNGAGDIDIFRGAGASVAAARVALTVLPMTKEEAQEFGIAEDLRRSFFRVDPAKSNYAPAHAAEWFELSEYELDNGERAAAAIPWEPPGDRTLDASEQTTLEDAIAAGINGHAFSPQLTDKQWRSVASVFVRFGIASKEGQRQELKRLLGNGFAIADFVQPSNRHIRQGLRRNDGSPKVEWT